MGSGSVESVLISGPAKGDWDTFGRGVGEGSGFDKAGVRFDHLSVFVSVGSTSSGNNLGLLGDVDSVSGGEFSSVGKSSTDFLVEAGDWDVVVGSDEKRCFVSTISGRSDFNWGGVCGADFQRGRVGRSHLNWGGIA